MYTTKIWIYFAQNADIAKCRGATNLLDRGYGFSGAAKFSGAGGENG